MAEGQLEISDVVDCQVQTKGNLMPFFLFGASVACYDTLWRFDGMILPGEQILRKSPSEDPGPASGIHHRPFMPEMRASPDVSWTSNPCRKKKFGTSEQWWRKRKHLAFSVSGRGHLSGCQTGAGNGLAYPEPDCHIVWSGQVCHFPTSEKHLLFWGTGPESKCCKKCNGSPGRYARNRAHNRIL